MRRPFHDRRSVVIATAALTLSAAVAGCSSDADSSDTSGENDLTRVDLGNLVYVGTAPLQLGIEKGFFDEEGLELVQTDGDDPAAIAGQLTAGQIDIGFTTTAFLAAAVSQGLPLKAIAPVEGLIDTEAPASGILVPSDSPIQELTDLEGKKVGVVALGSALHALTLADVDAADGDSSTIEPVQIPFPQMSQAMAAGNVDAIVTTEPFLSDALADGARMIAMPEVDIVPNGTVTAWAASESFINDNPDVVERFARAMEQTLTYSNEHPDEVLELIPEYAGLDAAQLEDMNLGTIYEPELDGDSIEKMSELMKTYGFIDSQPSVDDLVYQP